MKLRQHYRRSDRTDEQAAIYMTPTHDHSFGAQLRRLRQAAGLTQEQLADRAGLTVKGVSALERGERQYPYPHTVQALVTALDLTGDVRAALIAAVPQRTGTPAVAPPPHERKDVAPAPPALQAELLGRERDVAAVQEMLASGSVRLVTLTGPGGVGKTRLATELAHRVRDKFADGVVLVALAPLRDAALVLPTIAQTLGLRETSMETLRDALLGYLRERRMLLVLDNFEHVLEAVPEIAELLTACAGLVILATSRAPLRIFAEHEYPVGPLALPELSRIPAVDEVAAVASVQLFARRAQQVAPAFELSRTNAAAVAAICRRLDGLPLALELAAARVRLLSPTELLKRLDRALPILVGGARDLPERQQTMRRAIEWSYDLLDPDEQALFRQLSVFAGGWTLEAAEAVNAGNLVSAEDLLDSLADLVEQSLVVAEASADGDMRYRMLEPVRQYARERLEQSGELEAISRAHVTIFLALAEAAMPEIEGHDQVAWLDRLELENDNLRAAIGWSLESGDLHTVARFGYALRMYWVMRVRHSEGRLWLEQAVARDGDLPAIPRGKARYALAICIYGSRDVAHLLAVSEESLALFQQAGDVHYQALAAAMVAFAATQLDDLERAEAIFHAGLEVLRAAGDTWAAAHLLNHLTAIALKRRQYAEATRWAEEALACALQTGDGLGRYVALYLLAQTAEAKGDTGEAARFFAEALRGAAEVMDRANASYGIRGLGRLAADRGDLHHAAVLLAAASALLESVGAPIYAYAVDQPLHERAVESVGARLGEPAWTSAWERGRAMTLQEAVAEALGDGTGGPANP